MIDTDTIVIGGGISGLFAALRLQDLKIPYLLLEAKPDFGGRIAGNPVGPGFDVCIDLGPTWFWPHQKLMRELLSRLQVEWLSNTQKEILLFSGAQVKHPFVCKTMQGR
jgi:monoamine oxidase